MPSGGPRHASSLGDGGRQRLRACKGHSSKCPGEQQQAVGAGCSLGSGKNYLLVESRKAFSTVSSRWDCRRGAAEQEPLHGESRQEGQGNGAPQRGRP